MSATHPSAEQLERYRRRTATPAELPGIDEHLGRCDACFDLAGGSNADELVVLPNETSLESTHLTYDEIERWVDGRADAVERELVEGHVEFCSACRAELDDLRQVGDTVAGRSSKAGLRWMAAAAALAIVLGGLWLTRRNERAPSATSVRTTPAPNPPGPPPARDPLSPELRAQVERVIRTGELQKPEVVASLAGNASPLLGSEPSGPAFALIEPIATVVLDARPTFRWKPLPGATSYRVTIADFQSGEIAASGSSTATSWQPHHALAPGRTYSWQVKARRNGTEVTVPLPPAPEALFKIAKDEEIGQWKSEGLSSLDLGILLAERGALDDAERELQSAADSGSSQASALLAQVRSWRSYSPRPITTKAPQ
jgi:hypothetical protein